MYLQQFPPAVALTRDKFINACSERSFRNKGAHWEPIAIFIYYLFIIILFCLFLYIDFWNVVFNAITRSSAGSSSTIATAATSSTSSAAAAATSPEEHDKVTFNSIANICALYSRGSEKEKLEFGFNLFNPKPEAENNKSELVIEQEEVVRSLKSIYNLLSDKYTRNLPSYLATPEQAAALVFKQAKQKRANKSHISKAAYVEQCSSNLQNLNHVQQQWIQEYEKEMSAKLKAMSEQQQESLITQQPQQHPEPQPPVNQHSDSSITAPSDLVH